MRNSPILKNKSSKPGAHQQALGTPSTDPNWDTEFADRISEESKALASRQENGPLDADFSTQEVARAIQKLDYHKAAAEDGTRNPTYKCGGDPMVEALTSLFNHLKEVESCPADWSKSIVVNLYKDGSRTDPSNYRGNAIKLFGKTLPLTLGEAYHCVCGTKTFGMPRGLSPKKINDGPSADTDRNFSS